MAAKTKFRGSLTALVTPFKNGALDEAALRGLVSWQIEQGSHGLVPVGTTGESPTLSHAEHHRVVEMCIDEAKGRVPVIAGAGDVDLIARRMAEKARHFLPQHVVDADLQRRRGAGRAIAALLAVRTRSGSAPAASNTARASPCQVVSPPPVQW